MRPAKSLYGVLWRDACRAKQLEIGAYLECLRGCRLAAGARAISGHAARNTREGASCTAASWRLPSVCSVVQSTLMRSQPFEQMASGGHMWGLRYHSQR